MNLPIGIFDSGVGGLTVVKELKKALPEHAILYFGDTARVPYGTKSPETIVRYSHEIGGFLYDQGIQALVIACNTASAHAAEALAQTFPIPVYGVIEPGAKMACETTRTGRIGVIGTKATISSKAYERAIRALKPDAEIFSTPCPLFVPLVEEQFMNRSATELIAREYLRPLLEQGIDTLLLGCTHYPLLKPLLEKIAGPQVTIVDSASALAEVIQEASPCLCRGEDRFFVSDDPEKFRQSGELFLERTISIETAKIRLESVRPPQDAPAQVLHSLS